MPKVRFRLPVTVEVSEGTLHLIESAAPFVRALREHAPALRAVKDAGAVFGREVGRAIQAEQRKRPKKPRRKRV